MMTNLFGLNITDNKDNTVLDGEVFCTDRISADQEAEIGSFLEEGKQLEKQSSLPLPLSVVKGICLFTWVITLIGTLNALADGTSLSQGHKNAPVLDWVGIICFVIWLALQIVREAGADPAGMTYEEKQKLQAKIVRRLASRGFSGGVCYRAARETVK